MAIGDRGPAVEATQVAHALTARLAQARTRVGYVETAQDLGLIDRAHTGACEATGEMT